MLLSLKELFVVLVIAAVVFRLAKPAAILFITPDDLSRRRRIWYALTVAAFLSPNFWLFALVAIPVTVLGGRKDSNPSALYIMLLQVIPPVDIPVPMFGMGRLLDINNYILLSCCIMVPAAMRLVRSKDASRLPGFTSADICLISYGMLTSFLYLHYLTPDGSLYAGSLTESLRRAAIFIIDIYVPFFVISRACRSHAALIDAMASACLNCALLSGIAIFESARNWLLYGEMGDRWTGFESLSSYVVRGGILRAMASTGHSMALGYMLVVAFGLWLYLQTRVDSARFRIGATVLFVGGFLAAYTRGAWVGAILAYFLFAALRPHAFSKFAKAIGAATLVGCLVYVSPLGDRIIRVIPAFGGSVDTYNILYRQQLFDRAWQIIEESPMLGDQGALLKMQDLRQGQGIIDLVNTYLNILLNNGFVGLTLFLLFILIPMVKAWSVSRRFSVTNPDLGALGASIVACVIAMLVILENGSLLGGPEKMFFALVSFSAAYAYFGRSPEVATLPRRG